MVEKELAQRIGIALRELRRGTAQDLRSRLYSDIVDLAQADALEVVAGRGECMMSELAAELRVDASAATRTVRRLANAGLLKRSSSPSDARAVVVSLTPEGQRLVQEISRRGMTAMHDILDEFEPHDQACFAELLEQFVRGIDQARSSGASRRGDVVNSEPGPRGRQQIR